MNIPNFSNFEEAKRNWNLLTEEKKEIARKRKMRSTRCVFVKKKVSSSEWNSWYSFHPYCSFGSNNYGEVVVGYVIAMPQDRILPVGASQLTDDEIRIYQNWAEANNIYPRPMTKGETVKEQIANKMEKYRSQEDAAEININSLGL